MRIKGVLLLMLCIGFTTVFYLLIGDPKPTINNIMTETHRQLSHLKGVVISGNSFHNNNNDINSEESEQKCDKYLRALGFNSNRGLFNNNNLSNNSLPVFVTAINSEQINLAKGFVKSFRDYITFNYSLIIYDLGLNEQQIQLISSVCNESQSQTPPQSLSQMESSSSSSTESEVGSESRTQYQTSCTIRKFNYDIFPSHVSDLKLFAFRPIILQEVLNQTGAALWLDPHYYLIPEANHKANQLVEKGRKEGIISWTIDQPTSSLTHPRMFEYFKTPQDNYFFHRMIKPSHILLYNTGRIHNDLMLPWVRCALTPECIAPIGSQASGCRFDKKPLYRYSGCHHYDTSAINVVLGVMFNYNEKPYSANEDDKFFRAISIDDKFDDIYTDDDIVDGDYVTGLNIKTNHKINNSYNSNSHTITTQIRNRFGSKSYVESLNTNRRK